MFSKKKKNALAAAQDKSALQSVDPGKRLLPERSRKTVSRAPDAYFVKLTKGARLLRYAVTFLLVVFTVAMAFVYSEEITGEKLKLLMRNASFSFPGEHIAFTTVRYDADPEMDFAAYREYFAVATTSGIRLYDHRGNIALDRKIGMERPTIDAGKDYIVVFDREGKNYLVCNSVTALYSGSTDFPIYSADVCDNGSYLIVTGSSSYLCVMTVYNRSFKAAREVRVNRYPLYAGLSDDGKMMMLLSYTVNASGRYESHVGFYDLSEETKLKNDYVSEDLPLGGRMTASGAVVFYADRAVVFSGAGEMKNILYFEKSTPTAFTCADGVAAVSFIENTVTGENSILCFDSESGESFGCFPFIGRIEKLFAAHGLIFIGEKDGLTALAPGTAEQRRIRTALPEKIFAGVNDALFFCFRNKAENMSDQTEIKELTDKTASAQGGANAGSEQSERNYKQ